MQQEFHGRRVVVTGGSRGIGRAIALGFAAAGAQVALCARGAESLAATAAELAAPGRPHFAAACDLADGAAVARFFEAAAGHLGGIDVLVHNASGFGRGDTEEAWQLGFDVDLLAMVRSAHAALPWLERASGACMVHIASIAGLRPAPRTPAYGAAKAAMIHYTLSQAALLARRGIRVNCIAPGSIEFPGGMWDELRRQGDPLYGRILASIPFGRLGTPEEIAEVALFLASPAARWITGQVLAVDGGQMLGA
jgi:3-oxoacyl-[acyl-carrier protein] reductase